ncbi:MAG: PLDc N-terminal domain-containing protein [Pseudomonadota bacterium]
MGIEVGGIFGLLVLICDIWAIIHIAQSSASAGAKALWIVLVLLLPVLGLIIWFFAGPRSGKSAG